MDVWWVPPVGTMERHEAGNLKELLERPEGFCWVDIAHCDEQAAGLLSGVFVSEDLHQLADELRNQFEILLGMCNAEEKFLQGVLDFYQSRTATQMNTAMERLALITVVMLPITAVASIYGMNIIVNGETDFPHLWLALALMAAVSAGMLQWAKRQGWW